EQGTMERMLGHYRTLLEAVVANPDERVSRLPLLTEAERRQLLVDWRGPRRDFPPCTCLHQQFEAQADRTPDAVAVESGVGRIGNPSHERRLTYRQLNERANRLAHLLRRAGVGRGDFVAVLQRRGADFLVAILGVFKAGAAYVPIDPN